MTETQVNAEIQTHARYKQVCGLVIEAKTEMGLLKGMSYALKQRMDVLTTVSRNLQSEMRDATVGGQMQEDRRAKVKSILNGLKAFEDD